MVKPRQHVPLLSTAAFLAYTGLMVLVVVITARWFLAIVVSLVLIIWSMGGMAAVS